MGAEILRGDCLPILRGMAENSIDLIATDPPYGIGFMGKSWDSALPDPAVWRECLRVLKPGGSAVVMSGSRLDCLWRMCRDLEAAGFELSQTALYWCYRSGFPKGSDLSKMADKQVGAEREVVGVAKGTGKQNPAWNGIAAGRKENSLKPFYDATVASSPLAVELDGWFTKGKVKPAVEVIIWARKPISERTELANVERWGVGGVNCGACMVPTDDLMQGGYGNAPVGMQQKSGAGAEWQVRTGTRYPANLLCTEDALGEGSRYFDIDAWAAEHGFTEDGWVEAAAAGVLQVPKPSRAEKNAGCDGLPESKRYYLEGDSRPCNRDKETTQMHQRAPIPITPNPHPTCKPVRLFAYLAEFLCPAGGTVLDPFAGSGTTGVAAVRSGRSFIGCELSDEYATIAEARIAHAIEAAKPAQLSMDAA